VIIDKEQNKGNIKVEFYSDEELDSIINNILNK